MSHPKHLLSHRTQRITPEHKKFLQWFARNGNPVHKKIAKLELGLNKGTVLERAEKQRLLTKLQVQEARK